MLLLSCISLLTLIACGSDGGESPDFERETPSIPNGDEIFGFSIEIISDDQLMDLNEYYEVDYAVARRSFITEGFNLHFDFSQPVRNFTLIDVAHSEHGSVVKTGTLFEVGDLNPDRPLVLTYYFNNGMTGFYFDGPGSEGGWFVFEKNVIDSEISVSRFDWSHDRELFIVDGDLVIDPNEIEGMMPEVNPETEPEEIILSITRLVGVDADADNDDDEDCVDEECENSDISDDDDDDDEGYEEVDFEQLLNYYNEKYNFNSIHTVDYNYVREARDGFVNLGELTSDTLLIRTNVPLRDFAVVLVGNDVIEGEDGVIFIPIESFGMVDYLLPEDAFIIKNYVGLGTIPWSGITFLDHEGEKKYYAIVQDQSGLFDPYLLIPFYDGTDKLPDGWEPWWEEDEEIE